MGLVKGFTDIIAPQNLATNGCFRINQRGLFAGTYAPIKVGDFLCDVWTLASQTTVDYVEALTAANFGYASLKGYGKKGQIIYLYNRDLFPFSGDTSHAVQDAPLTASISVRPSPSMNTVPFSVRVYPRRHTNFSVTYMKDYIFTPKSGNDGGKAVCAITSDPTFNNGNAVIITLLADGDFLLYLSDYNEVFGNYANPPIAPISYHDDLLRCKRYYQRDYLDITQKPVFLSSSGAYSVYQDVKFPVSMAGAPTANITVTTAPTAYKAPPSTGGYTPPTTTLTSITASLIDSSIARIALVFDNSVDFSVYPLIWTSQYGILAEFTV